MGIAPKTLSLGIDSSQELQSAVRMLFLLLEGSRPHSGSTRHTLVDVDEIILGRGESRLAKRTTVDGRRILHISIPDSWMSTRHSKITLNNQNVVIEDLGSKNGTSVNGMPIHGSQLLASSDLIELGCTFLTYVDAPNCDVRDAMQRDIHSEGSASGMATLLPNLRSQMRQLKKIAKSTASVIVYGESGTGKELIAQAIHDQSGRSGPFVPVNCAAITESLLESELFGHKRGAFSGAIADRKGLIEASSGGTLFLDEIGELSAKGQASLLRVLQQQEVMPVGANQAISVNLRVIAATHRELLRDVAQGAFREDLYARLSTFVATVPPLRERIPEFGSIVATLLSRSPQPLPNVCFTPQAARALLQYLWPRNIRELEKCLTSAVVLADAGRIEHNHLSELVRHPPTQPEVSRSTDDTRLRSQLIVLLQAHTGNVTQVGNAMGKKRQQIQKWCKRLDIDPKQYR